MMRRQHSNNKYWLAIAILFIVFTLFVDIIAGLFLIPRTRGYHRKYHYYYHHDFVPNKEALEYWGKDYIVHTNSLGFKDKSIRNVPLAVDKRRIVFMGDSFTEGIG